MGADAEAVARCAKFVSLKLGFAFPAFPAKNQKKVKINACSARKQAETMMLWMSV